MTRPHERLPYPGLRPFRQDESDLFFGREQSVDEMVDLLAEARFLAVLGPSGSGKSSLVRTGLLDALELGLHPSAGSRWQVVDLHPGTQPVRSLAEALLAGHGNAGPGKVDDLTEFLRRGPLSIVRWAAGGNLPAGTNLLLLIDQFEEIFRYGDYSEREQAECFVGLLLESAAAPEIPIHVVITMRSEYLGACTLLPGLAERINEGLYLTPRLGREACRAAIRGPAGVLGFEVGEALVNRLLNDLESFSPWEGDDGSELDRLSRQADQLPLMQHVLNRLWVRARQQQADGEAVLLDLDEYEAVGGLTGALASHGSEVIESLGESRLPLIEGVFRSLVDGPSLALAVRRPCRLGDLVALTGGPREEVVEVVESFRAPDCNFLRTSNPSLEDDDVIVDLTHESLIRQWPPLAAWLESEAQDIAAWQRLVAGQRHHARGEGDLLRGLDLQKLSHWWEDVAPAPSWAERHGGDYQATRDFLEESRRVEAEQVTEQHRRETRERNRLRAGVISLAVALALTTALGILAWYQAAAKEELVARYSTTLEEIGGILSSDRYVRLLGIAPLQSELMEKLIPYQSDMQARYDKAVDPATIVENKHQFAEALTSLGMAPAAMRNYREAFDHAQEALDDLRRGQVVPVPLAASILAAGSDYAWLLFDLGEEEKALGVLRSLRRVETRRLPPGGSDDLALARAKLANLESRYHFDRHESAESRHHLLRAIALLHPIAERPDATMETMRMLAVFQGNLEIEESLDALGEICGMATRMMQQNPLDRRAARSHVTCLRTQARKALAAGELEEARERLSSAADFLGSRLGLIPGDQEMSLDLAHIENDFLYLETDAAGKYPHALRASELLVQALEDRTLLQSSTDLLVSLYTSCVPVAAESLRGGKGASGPSEEERALYWRLIKAVEPTLDAFPRAPTIAYVAADAHASLGNLLTDAPEQAERHFSEAIDNFSIAMPRVPTSYSERYRAKCAAYDSRIGLYSSDGRLDEALADLDAMRQACLPMLEQFPWDIYLRQTLLNANAVAGQALFESERHSAAVPLLDYACEWGRGESCDLLEQASADSLGLTRDEERAEHFRRLSRHSGVRRFSIPIRFGKLSQTVEFYVGRRSAKYPFTGIDDQVRWWKEARGGEVAAEIADAFRSLHATTGGWEVPFGDVCLYALGLVAEQRGGVPMSGDVFDLRGAVRLMSRGSVPKIIELKREHGLDDQLQRFGERMLDAGVEPDIAMMARIREIELEIMEEILQKRLAARQAEEPRPPADG